MCQRVSNFRSEAFECLEAKGVSISLILVVKHSQALQPETVSWDEVSIFVISVMKHSFSDMQCGPELCLEMKSVCVSLIPVLKHSQCRLRLYFYRQEKRVSAVL